MVGPFMADAEKLAAVREGLPSVAAGIYLNTPISGPLPAETAQAMAEIAAWELTTGRAARDRPDEVAIRVDEARAALAAVLGTDVDRVELTHGLTDGIARVVTRIGWRPDDRVLAIGEPGVDTIVDAMRDVLPDGVEKLVLAPPDDLADDDDEQLIAALGDALRRPPRLVAYPHVTALGRVLPVARLAALAREAGSVVLVDGGQAAGAMPVSVDELGVDFYLVPGWRWLLGPEGIGGLAVGPRRAPAASSGADAGRLAGEFHLPSVVGLARSCGWLSMYVGLEWIHTRAALLARAAAQQLTAIPGVTLLTPFERMATTVSFRIAGWSGGDALDELGARVFALASVIEPRDAIRIGPGFFNTEDEVTRFAGGVELLASHTPASLPPRRQLTIIGGDR